MNDNSGLTVYVSLQTQSINLNWITMTNTDLKVIYKYNKCTTASVMPLESVRCGGCWNLPKKSCETQRFDYNRNERERSLPMVECYGDRRQFYIK